MKTDTSVNRSKRSKGIPKLVWAGLAVCVIGGGIYWLRHRGDASGQVAVFEVRRGPLNISVMEGGSVRAVESQEIKCEVRVGYQGLKILKIVEEGYEVTQDDIRTNKVLVELDSSDLQKQITQQDIQYESAVASLTDAQQNYEIQLNQNLSDIKAAEQKVRFARMDFDKYLGAQITQSIVDQIGVEKELAAEETSAAAARASLAADRPGPKGTQRPGAVAPQPADKVEVPAKEPAGSGGGDGRETVTSTKVAIVPAGGNASIAVKPAVLTTTTVTTTASLPENDPTASSPPVDATPPADAGRPKIPFDFAKYASLDLLGDGEAKQKLRKFEDDLQVAKKEQGQAKADLEGTKRLFDKGFVTRNELEKSEIANDNSRLKVQTAETARELYLQYEFPKSAEEALSKYAETCRELARARKAAVSKLAQAQAKLKSSQGQYNIQSRQRKELYEQQDKCLIKATKPGLVVYGRGGDEMFYYGGEERIREGATVRERQSIITIPDMSKMSVRVRIDESYIKKVKKGQKARVTVDAYPDKIIDGEVTTVGVLPDSQNMWMNPDMKVYLTTITLSGTNDWLKPGMTAKVEILVNRLDDVVYVPLQAVSPWNDKQVCYIPGGAKPERRVVQTGEFNDEFIEIKKGVKPGERVLLKPAESPPPEKAKKDQDQTGKESPQKAAPPATSART